MRRFFLAVMALALAWNAAAQTAAASHPAQFGLLVGVTSSATDIKSAWAEAEDITQYHAGIALKIPMGDFFALQPMLTYNIKGAKISDQDSDDFKADFKTGFIEFPLQLQVGFPLGEDFRVFGLAEPFIGYAVTNESKAELGDIEETRHNWDSVKNRLEYGASAGAGIELAGGIQLQVKYFWNFGTIYKDSEHPGTNPVDAVKHEKCSGIMATLGFLF